MHGTIDKNKVLRLGLAALEGEVKANLTEFDWAKRQLSRDPTNFRGLVLGGGGGGRPDYLQKLKVPEGYEKMIDYSNI